MTSVFQLGGRYWQKIFVRFGAMCLPGATRIFMHWVCTGRQDGQEEILPKQNRHVGKIKGRENSRPEIIGSKKRSVHRLCLEAVGGCQHATPPVHPTIPNRAEDRILNAPSDGPQQNGIIHKLPPCYRWLRTYLRKKKLARH